MNIRIQRSARAGGILIPRGDYVVSADELEGQVVLINTETVLRVGALRRAAKARVTAPTVQLRQVVGEERDLLIVRTPPATEWVVSLDRAGD